MNHRRRHEQAPSLEDLRVPLPPDHPVAGAPATNALSLLRHTPARPLQLLHLLRLRSNGLAALTGGPVKKRALAMIGQFRSLPATAHSTRLLTGDRQAGREAAICGPVDERQTRAGKVV